jgi:IS5 family transposase
MTRAADPQFSFADVEFLNQNVKLDPLLQAVASFLDRHGELVETVRRDLERGLKNPGTGRSGLTAQQVLRALILQRVKNWDYRELRERIADGYTLRRFTDFYSRRVPKHDAFNRAFNRLTVATLRVINQMIVQAAVDLGLEDGRKLRVDTTVVETDIHHPTDSTLLWDSVRVLTRLVERLDELLAHGVGAFPNRTRRARRRMQEIQRMTPAQRQRRQLRKYRDLIHTAEEVVANARAVLNKTRKVRAIDVLNELALQDIRSQIEHHCGLALKVVDQARRRVLQGQSVPSGEKIYSIFEPHTDLIKRGKVDKPIEFGHKVFLAESARGLITQYAVLDGNPIDETQVRPALQRHTQSFGEAPELFSGDRGFFSQDSIGACQHAGVVLTCIPQRGGHKTTARQMFEKTPAFKKGQRFRAGIEGRISVLFRGRGMKRCRAEGREHFELFVGAAVLANNLMVIAELLIKKKRRRAAA